MPAGRSGGPCPRPIVIAVVAGILVGLPSLRLRSDYFAIATIAFAEIVRYTFQNADFAGGNQGIIGFDQQWRDVSDWLLDRFDQIGLGDLTQLPLFLADLDHLPRLPDRLAPAPGESLGPRAAGDPGG